MTPAARVAASIEILDDWLGGAALDIVLARWGRANRYAGSKDRAAIRDFVYEAVRCRRSFGWLGGGDTGRALAIGALRASGADVDAIFSNARFAPTPLSAEEQAFTPAEMPDAVALDLPDWIVPDLKQSLGAGFAEICAQMRHRAPVFLRVNLARGGRDTAQVALAKDGMETRPHPLSPTALEVTAGARRVAGSAAFADGLVELQDVASQAVVDTVPLAPGASVLDYCAGGGGKSLALAARGAQVSAHDIDAKRMTDIPGRAKRAGVQVRLCDPGHPGDGYDVVVVDAPCSGSGSWRRAPQGKWLFTPDRLQALTETQATILDDVAGRVRLEGTLAYMTCSFLEAENQDQVRSFLARHPNWILVQERLFTPLDGGDGFFVAILQNTA